MNAEERLRALKLDRRIDDHFVDFSEMIESGTMAENLPPAESIKKLESRQRKQPKALEQPPGETDITGNSSEDSGM